MWLLIDCDNFFVACERLFQPHLEGKPVVVLAHNDGCCIARSCEAKKLGIAMGAPWFRVKAQYGKQVYPFSANLPLYADLSRRLMRLLQKYGKLFPYSIDEAFLQHAHCTLEDAHAIRFTIQRALGLPLSIGGAPTRILAKLATRHAKRTQQPILWSLKQAHHTLQKTPIEHLWGIGPGLTRKFHQLGCFYASHILHLPLERVQRHIGVVGMQIALGLQGIDPGPQEVHTTTLQVGRTFAQPIAEKWSLRNYLLTLYTRLHAKVVPRFPTYIGHTLFTTQHTEQAHRCTLHPPNHCLHTWIQQLQLRKETFSIPVRRAITYATNLQTAAPLDLFAPLSPFENEVLPTKLYQQQLNRVHYHASIALDTPTKLAVVS